MVLVAVSLFVAGSLSPLGGGGRAAAQIRSCDPLLEQPTTNPNGYRLRGDRCEGIYIQQVAGTPLVVASFTESFEEYDARSARNLIIRWSAPPSGDVHLRALGLRRKLYYRMDTTRSSSGGSYTWPADMLGALNIGKVDVGLAGWTRYRVGPTDRDVYVPVNVGRPEARSASNAYTLVLLPGVPLSEVYVSMALVGSDGRPAKFVRDEEPLRYNYYPAERPIDILITKPMTPGVYYVLLGATLTDGGSLTTELWFYHPR